MGGAQQGMGMAPSLPQGVSPQMPGLGLGMNAPNDMGMNAGVGFDLSEFPSLGGSAGRGVGVAGIGQFRPPQACS